MRNTSDGGKLNPNYSARWKSPGGAKENFRFNNNLMIVRVSWEIYFSKSPENVRIFTFFAAVFAWIEWDWSWKINPHPIPTLHSKAVIALFYMTGYFDVFSIIFIDKEKIKKKLSFFSVNGFTSWVDRGKKVITELISLQIFSTQDGKLLFANKR